MRSRAESASATGRPWTATSQTSASARSSPVSALLSIMRRVYRAPAGPLSARLPVLRFARPPPRRVLGPPPRPRVPPAPPRRGAYRRPAHVSVTDRDEGVSVVEQAQLE